MSLCLMKIKILEEKWTGKREDQVRKKNSVFIQLQEFIFLKKK